MTETYVIMTCHISGISIRDNGDLLEHPETSIGDFIVKSTCSDYTTADKRLGRIPKLIDRVFECEPQQIISCRAKVTPR